jgi:RNA polymerase sigma-70 factor, ECF subfamily
MTGTVDESALIAALRDGDEAVFAQLVDRHTPSMLRVARGYIPSHEIAEEVVQETWIALLKGIDNFEGRSSLRTWLFAVMINIAKARGVRERRDADAAVAAYTGGTVDPARCSVSTRSTASWRIGWSPRPSSRCCSTAAVITIGLVGGFIYGVYQQNVSAGAYLTTLTLITVLPEVVISIVKT